MPAKLKVFGHTGFVRPEEAKKLGLKDHARQARVVIAAPSKAAAARTLGIKMHYFNSYVCETGNPTEVEAAMSRPGVVFVGWAMPAQIADRTAPAYIERIAD
jgi:hypothetical protein